MSGKHYLQVLRNQVFEIMGLQRAKQWCLEKFTGDSEVWVILHCGPSHWQPWSFGLWNGFNFYSLCLFFTCMLGVTLDPDFTSTWLCLWWTNGWMSRKGLSVVYPASSIFSSQGWSYASLHICTMGYSKTSNGSLDQRVSLITLPLLLRNCSNSIDCL